MPSGQSCNDLVVVAYYLLVLYFLFVPFGISSVTLWSLRYVYVTYSRLIVKYKVRPCSCNLNTFQSCNMYKMHVVDDLISKGMMSDFRVFINMVVPIYVW